MRALLASDGGAAMMRAADAVGWTPLHIATHRRAGGHRRLPVQALHEPAPAAAPRCVRLLLKHGAPPAHAADERRATPARPGGGARRRGGAPALSAHGAPVAGGRARRHAAGRGAGGAASGRSRRPDAAADGASRRAAGGSRLPAEPSAATVRRMGGRRPPPLADFLSAYSAVNQGRPRARRSCTRLTEQAARLTLTPRVFHNNVFGEYAAFVTDYFGIDRGCR